MVDPKFFFSRFGDHNRLAAIGAVPQRAERRFRLLSLSSASAPTNFTARMMSNSQRIGNSIETRRSHNRDDSPCLADS